MTESSAIIVRFPKNVLKQMDAVHNKLITVVRFINEFSLTKYVKIFVQQQ